MLQPISIYGVLERIHSGNVVQNVLFNQRFSCTGNHRRRREPVFIHDGFGGEVLLTCGHGAEKTQLLVGKRLGHRVEHQAELGRDRGMGFIDRIKRCNLISAQPYLLGKLLDIVRMILDARDDFLADIITDGFARPRECALDELHPVRSLDLLQEHDVAELVKRHGVIREHFKHHVPFAAIQAISHILVLLEMGAKLFLERERIVKCGNVLE